MVYAKFTHTLTNVTTNRVTQWDYGRTLRIEGLKLPTAIRIDFCISGDQNTISRIGITKDGVTDVVIPDILLEQPQAIAAYVYLNEEETGKTIRTINIPVVSRPQPEEYDTPEGKKLFNNVAVSVEESESTAKTHADSAKESLESTIKAKNEAVKAIQDEGAGQVKVIQDEGATQIEALQGFASAIKGKATGNVIKVDDVSPVEHDLKVKADGATRVSRYSKNLVDISKGLKDTVFIKNDDESYTLTKTGSGGLRFTNRMPLSIPANTLITVSLDVIENTSTTGVHLVFGLLDGTEKTKTVSTNRTLIFDGYVTDLRIYIEDVAENGTYVRFSNLQIELGETATEYEPYKGQTVEVVDGTVTGLTSVSPNMTILADTEGAMIECEYNIDTKTYIDRKIAELTTK